MQSSYNVIKNESIIHLGEININTVYKPESNQNLEFESEEILKEEYESYENLAKTMLENARKKSDELIFKARNESENLKVNAYKEGYEAGKKEGYDKAYSETIEEAKGASEKIISNAENILYASKIEYESYLKEKAEDIKKLAISIAEDILRREVKEKNGMDAMILNALETSRNVKTFIIRCNREHFGDIKENIQAWKEKIAFNGDIFVIEDNLLSIGNALIEKNNGKIEVGIDVGLDKIKAVIEGD